MRREKVRNLGVLIALAVAFATELAVLYASVLMIRTAFKVSDYEYALHQKVVQVYIIYAVGAFIVLVLTPFAAWGARNGKGYGKVISRIVAIPLLIGFPLGTLLSIFIAFKSFRSWQSAQAQ